MPTIAQEIKRLLPRGSRPGSRGRITGCPLWPPDLFAVMASLVRLSQCYTWPEFIAPWEARTCCLDDTYVRDVVRIGALWAETTALPADVVRLWEALHGYGDREVARVGADVAWAEIIMRLMAIADEASSGIGFAKSMPFGKFLFAQHIAHLRNSPDLLLRNIPTSLCMMVPIQEACVQPKSNTPQLGCTLRSLSHNLALLPPERTVAISWLFNTTAEAPEKPLNLLVVPFPYVLRGRDFVQTSPILSESDDQFFSLEPNWLKNGSRWLSPRTIAAFISELVVAARREAQEVHGVVLPEDALDARCADQVAALLARQNRDLEFFITGVVSNSRTNPRNMAVTYRFQRGRIFNRYQQSKHHRWCLDGPQIARYHLGHTLSPGNRWWERIHVDERAVAVSVMRYGASLAVLICEDLARHDPVMPALQAVGPNLVIALLMDGPQFERRWPGRYATVLAEDPGSSVLTLTSLGMVRRSSMPGEPERREVALWKERGQDAKELRLATGDLALLLSLTLEDETQFALDGRSDGGASRQFKLSGVRGIGCGSRPSWLGLD